MMQIFFFCSADMFLTDVPRRLFLKMYKKLFLQIFYPKRLFLHSDIKIDSFWNNFDIVRIRLE